MAALTLGLRIVYDGFRALKINVTEHVDTLVDEVYQDTAALRLTPPRRKAVFKPNGLSDTLDMFWDTSESSTVYRQTRRAISSLDMDDPAIRDRNIVSARVYELPEEHYTITDNDVCVASAERPKVAALSFLASATSGSTAITSTQPVRSPSPILRTGGAPPTAPRSMSMRTKPEDALTGNGSLVHRTLASRIGGSEPYPTSGARRSPSRSGNPALTTSAGEPTSSVPSRSEAVASSSTPTTSTRPLAQGISILGASQNQSTASRKSSEARSYSRSRDAMDIERDRHRERDRERDRDKDRDREHDHDRDRRREHRSRDRERGERSERSVPEWRMSDEREGRRRAEEELAELRQKLDAALSREGLLHQDVKRLEAESQVAQAQTADFESKFRIAQRELAHVEDARRLLLGHNGSALRGSGTNIIDIVRSLERQIEALGEELAKERNLRQIAEDALNNMQRGVGIFAGNLAGASSSTGFMSAFGSGAAGALGTGAGGSNGNALNALVAGLAGQESQLAANLLKALVDQSSNQQVNGKLSS
ncbi:unnamed protein product [Peniophora sp. CBMAI 1063]|nr:unnamed protein product [Peniophora sp. CBMAI 1063]